MGTMGLFELRIAEDLRTNPEYREGIRAARLELLALGPVVWCWIDWACEEYDFEHELNMVQNACLKEYLTTEQ